MVAVGECDSGRLLDRAGAPVAARTGKLSESSTRASSSESLSHLPERAAADVPPVREACSSAPSTSTLPGISPGTSSSGGSPDHSCGGCTLSSSLPTRSSPGEAATLAVELPPALRAPTLASPARWRSASSAAGALAWLPRPLRRRAVFAAAAALVVSWAWSRYCAKLARRPRKWGSGRLAMLASSALVAGARRLGVTGTNNIETTLGEWRGKQVLACWHPHGLYTMAPFLFQSAGPRNRDRGTYGFFTAVAEACFKLPVFREILLLVNCRVADSRIIDTLLGAGKSVYLCPGGIHEQLESDPKQEQVFFPPNLGFIRQALRHGVPVVPTYNFGENQLYDVPDTSRALSRLLKDKLRIGLPLGVGKWGLPFVPRAQRITMHRGTVIEVGAPDENPSEERVREVFRRYCVELRRLFEAHKDADLPADVAARGLRLTWRGHEDEMDLSLEGLLGQEATEAEEVDEEDVKIQTSAEVPPSASVAEAAEAESTPFPAFAQRPSLSQAVGFCGAAAMCRSRL